MHRIRWITALGVAAAAAATACGGGNSTPPGPTPTQIAKVSGDSQIGAAGATLPTPFSVVVKDASGSPLANATVSWAVTDGGGSIASTGLTDGSGVSTGTRTLGPTAGTETATATHDGLSGSPITFTTFSQIQGATSMVVNGGGNQTDTVLATLTTPMSVFVRDYKNAPVANVTVSWSATGGGSVGQASTVTNSSGIASVSRTFGGTAGSQTTVATVSGLVGSPVSISSTATAGNPTQMVLNGGNNQTGSVNNTLATPHSVLVMDAQGNGKAGVTVTWAVGNGGGSVSSMSPVTGSNGVASVTRTLGPSAGTHTDTAKVNGLTGSPVVFSATAVTAPLTASVTVGSGGNNFSPSSVTIAAGGSVTWTWASGTVNHNVTWLTAPGTLPPNSSTMSGTGTFTPAAGSFSTAGTYTYECSIHGSVMSGQVIVQ
jgi:trimeric autotransporter adhesin